MRAQPLLRFAAQLCSAQNKHTHTPPPHPSPPSTTHPPQTPSSLLSARPLTELTPPLFTHTRTRPWPLVRHAPQHIKETTQQGARLGERRAAPFLKDASIPSPSSTRALSLTHTHTHNTLERRRWLVSFGKRSRIPPSARRARLVRATQRGTHMHTQPWSRRFGRSTHSATAFWKKNVGKTSNAEQCKRPKVDPFFCAPCTPTPRALALRS